ncbi:MAG: hypothetical protein ACKVHL_08805 [Rhodospirillales bacterium]
MDDDEQKHDFKTLPLAYNNISPRENKLKEFNKQVKNNDQPVEVESNVVTLKSLHKDWSPKEQKVFANLYDLRLGYGREALYSTGLDENNDPWFCLYVAMGGECIMVISRGDNGIGYYVSGPSRKTAYVRTIEELERGFAQLEEGYKAELINKK